MIVYGKSSMYYGVPLEHRPALETIVQAIVQSLYDQAVRVYKDPELDVWNCSVYRSSPSKGCQRLRIVNHSCGYWAIIEYEHPFPDQEKYAEWVDLRVFVSTSGTPQRPVNWRTYCNLALDGGNACALYIEARKVDDGWTASAHKMSFTHPLLHTLIEAE